jgi:ParB family chromosome partitioning protein
VIMEIGSRFYEYDKVKYGKAKGGTVYISCAGKGKSAFTKGGWTRRKPHGGRKRGKRTCKPDRKSKRKLPRQSRS